MKVLFYVFALSVFALMHWGVYRLFLVKIAPLKSRLFALLTGLNLLCIGLYIIGRYSLALPHFLYALFSLSVGICFILFISMLVYQCLSVIPRFAKKRRAFLQKSVNIFSSAFATGYFGWGVVEGGLKPEIKKIDLKLDLLKEKFSLLQVSDLHIGGLIDEAKVKEVVEIIHSTRADVIVFTGDIVDAKVAKISQALEELGKLQAPLGVYFVLGNHEYFHGVYQVLEAIKKLGFCVLQNQGVVLQKEGVNLINLLGVNDLFGRRFGALAPDLKQAMQGRVKGLPSILLAHQPKFALEVKDEVDLILSGHTHGGQIFPFGLFVKLDQPYLKGLYQHTPKTKIYVNQGTGFWGPPMRVCTRAELTLFQFSPSFLHKS